jgi:hypothetical protein
MDFEKFSNSVSVRYWMDGLNSNPDPHSTKYAWVRNLKRFCDWIGKDPDQLIEERKAQMKSDDPRVQHETEMILPQISKSG